MSNIKFPSFPDGFKDSPFGKIFKDDPPTTRPRRQRADRFFDRDPAPTKDKKALSFRRKVLFFQPTTDSQARVALLLRLPPLKNLDDIADIRSRIVLTNSQTMEALRSKMRGTTKPSGGLVRPLRRTDLDDAIKEALQNPNNFVMDASSGGVLLDRINAVISGTGSGGQGRSGTRGFLGAFENVDKTDRILIGPAMARFEKRSTGSVRIRTRPQFPRGEDMDFSMVSSPVSPLFAVVNPDRAVNSSGVFRISSANSSNFFSSNEINSGVFEKMPNNGISLVTEQTPTGRHLFYSNLNLSPTLDSQILEISRVESTLLTRSLRRHAGNIEYEGYLKFQNSLQGVLIDRQ